MRLLCINLIIEHMDMKKTILLLAVALLSMHATATVIPFSMDAEASGKNTPEGWTAVQLPTGLPAITEANTFVITDAPYNASTASEDNGCYTGRTRRCG